MDCCHRGRGTAELHSKIHCVLYSWLPFQEIKFYKGCIEACRSCTLSQVATWNHTLNFTFVRSEFVVALQTAIAEISINNCGNTSLPVHIQYISDRKPLKTWANNYNEPKVISSQNAAVDSFISSLDALVEEHSSHTVPKRPAEKMSRHKIQKCKTYVGYNKHTSIISTKTNMFIFIKYMDNTISSTTEYIDYFDFWWTKFHLTYFYNDTYSTCPNLTHNPKLFSWNEAAGLCKECMNAILPEFVSRDNQEEFFSVLRDAQNLFPLESAFIGLQKFSQKGVSKSQKTKPYNSKHVTRQHQNVISLNIGIF